MWMIFSLQFKSIFEIESLKTNKLTLVLRDVKISICNVGPLFKKRPQWKGKTTSYLEKSTLMIVFHMYVIMCRHGTAFPLKKIGFADIGYIGRYFISVDNDMPTLNFIMKQLC